MIEKAFILIHGCGAKVQTTAGLIMSIVSRELQDKLGTSTNASLS